MSARNDFERKKLKERAHKPIGLYLKDQCSHFIIRPRDQAKNKCRVPNSILFSLIVNLTWVVSLIRLQTWNVLKHNENMDKRNCLQNVQAMFLAPLSPKHQLEYAPTELQIKIGKGTTLPIKFIWKIVKRPPLPPFFRGSQYRIPHKGTKSQSGGEKGVGKGRRERGRRRKSLLRLF